MARRSSKKGEFRTPARLKGGGSLSDLQTPVASWLPWVLLICGLTLWIYWPALHGDWLWDDGLLINRNALVRDPAGLWKIWFQPEGMVDYQPLKFSVVWGQWQLWGNDTYGYHLTNVILHGTSALLVWRVLDKLNLRLAWLGGLLFAVHPVQVESVAWMAELKNTLSLPPFLGAICLYLDYDKHGKPRDYFLSVGLFVVAMLCKATMVMFPVVILLYAWWKKGRIGAGDLKASGPYFLISLVMGSVTVWFLHHHAIGEMAIPMGGVLPRVACGGLAIAFYFSKCLWPVGLLPAYPRWNLDHPTLLQFLPWPILGAVIYFLWIRRASWGRHVFFGLGFFLINLAPFLGFNAASYMRFTWVMDHVLYIPIIGLIGLAVAGIARIDEKLPPAVHPAVTGFVTVVVVLLSFLSHSYAAAFTNEETLWGYAVEHNPQNWLAQGNLGKALLQNEHPLEAIAHFEAVLNLTTERRSEALLNLGTALVQADRVPDGIKAFDDALKMDPNAADVHNQKGIALAQLGRASEAMNEFDQATKLKPDYSLAYNNLGVALAQSGRIPEAIEKFESALRIDPTYAEAHDNKGSALLKMNRPVEAKLEFQAALQFQPNDVRARDNLTRLEQEGK